MTSLSEFKRIMVPGAVVEVTNHYITREDHPCFGTTRRTVSKANGSSYWFDPISTQERTFAINWPKVPQVVPMGAKFLIYGHPKPDDLFLTISPVEVSRG